MSIHRVAWCVPANSTDFEKVIEVLGRTDLIPVPCPPEFSTDRECEFRVLYFDRHSDPEAMRASYEFDGPPTLVLVDTAEQENRMLEYLRDQDDLCRSDITAETIARRLTRLAAARVIRQTAYLASRDALTGLWNRRALQESLNRYLLEPTTEGHSAFLMVDLDRFKTLNDHHGHTAGDQILCQVAALLVAEEGPEDQASRIGGDKFALLFTRYDRPTLVETADTLRQRIAQHGFGCGDSVTSITVSIGLTFLGTQTTPEEIWTQADRATYEAKAKGRNTVVFYQSMQGSADQFDQDLSLHHFENVTRVVTERVSNLINLMGRQLVERARVEANHDGLTKLHNRRYFDSRLKREFENARKNARSLTVALMDIDHFHDVNVTYGWPTGDRVLNVFGELAQAQIRSVDWLARYGGEEFCLVMPDTAVADGIKVADRIREALQTTAIHSMDQREVRATVSIGVALLTDDIEDPVGLIQMASHALLAAKNGGRNRVVCHE